MLRVRSLGTVPYHEAYALQHALATEAADDYLLVLQHPHTYTLGKHADERHVLVDPALVGAVLERTDRGGDVTYHGPGQLVAYPVVTVPDDPAAGPAHVHRLEQVVIETLADLGLTGATSEDEYPGVWLDADGPHARKIAAIGVRTLRAGPGRRRTLHGVALNVTTDLAMFGHIVPCGIADRGVTSLAAEGIDVPMDTVVDAFVARAVAVFGEGSVERQDVVRGPRRRRGGGAPTVSPAAPGRGGTRGRPRHRAAKAPLGAGARAHRQGLSPTGQHRPRSRARHRVRGGGVPEHLRVLGRRDGDLHDQRGALYPGLRLLPGRHAPPPAALPGRARTGGPGGGAHGAGPCRGHVCRTRRPARRRCRRDGGDHRSHPRPHARNDGRGADLGLPGGRGVARRDLRGAVRTS